MLYKSTPLSAEFWVSQHRQQLLLGCWDIRCEQTLFFFFFFKHPPKGSKDHYSSGKPICRNEINKEKSQTLMHRNVLLYFKHVFAKVSIQSAFSSPALYSMPPCPFFEVLTHAFTPSILHPLSHHFLPAGFLSGLCH